MFQADFSVAGVETADNGLMACTGGEGPPETRSIPDTCISLDVHRHSLEGKDWVWRGWAGVDRGINSDSRRQVGSITHDSCHMRNCVVITERLWGILRVQQGLFFFFVFFFFFFFGGSV